MAVVWILQTPSVASIAAPCLKNCTIRGPLVIHYSQPFLMVKSFYLVFERPESMRMTTFVIAWKLLSIDYTSGAYNFPNGLGKMLP